MHPDLAKRHGPDMPTNRILVIEEEPLLALDIEDILTEARFGEVTHYRNVTHAQPHFDELSGFSLAIVEARFGAPEVIGFTERLAKAGVGVVVMSADHTSAQAFPHAAVVGKPFDAASLVAACRAVVASLNRDA